MSLVSDVSKDNFVYGKYVRWNDFSERKLKNANANLYISYADNVSKCGRFLEGFELYEDCCCSGDYSTKRIANSLMESVMTASGSPPAKNNHPIFACGICDNVLRHPATLQCGHTFCRRCLAKEAWRNCGRCGQKINGILETNVLVKRLAEKFWPGESMAAEIREEGDDFLQRNELEQAAAKYNEALGIVPGDHLTLCARSFAFCRMGKYQAALADAEGAIRMRPHWSKGYRRRGSALLAMGLLEEALVSFCIFVALERNPRAVRYEITKHTSALSNSDSSEDEDFCETPKCLPSSIRFDFHALFSSIFTELEKLKRVSQKSVDLNLKPSLVDKSDFECVLCCRTLWKPVTTPCGHTYCQACLDRSLDYSSACPLCMKNLSDYLTVSPKNVTEFLSKILKTHLLPEYLTRQIAHQAEISELAVSSSEKEPHVPVFVCTTAYPSIHCPLFIFEPRYRLMVRQCVEAGTRQFGIAACFSSENGTRRFADFGTMLEIKDLVLMSNGCSLLSTVGIRRFRTLSRGERDGYEMAKVKFLADEPIADSCLSALKSLHDGVREKALSWLETFDLDFKERVVTSFGTIPEVEDNWNRLPDGPSWTWWLLAILPLGPLLQVSILGTTSLEKRLRAIDKTLNQIQSNLRSQECNLKPSGDPSVASNRHRYS